MTKAYYFSTFSRDPYYNMSMDEWMFSRAVATPGLVLLRLYSWNEGTITFGFNQNLELAINRDLLGETPLIRRITGGRALYHELSELTYSIAVNTDNLECEKLNGLRFRSSQQIALGLVDFLARIGISAQYVRQSSANFSAKNAFHTQHCFQSKARHEIVSKTGKVAASAQRRIGAAFLQHGSIKIKEPISHPALAPGSSKSVTGKAIRPLSELDFIGYSKLFLKSFEELLGIGFEQSEPSEQDVYALNTYQNYLRKLCLAKRELIKQNPFESCLYIKAVN